MKLIKLLFLAFFLIIVFLIFIDRPMEKGNCRHNRILRKKVVKGVIIRKDYDTKSHSNEIVKLSNGKSFEWNNDRYKNFDLYNSMQIGDTLQKNEGELILTLTSSNTKDSFDLRLKCD